MLRIKMLKDNKHGKAGDTIWIDRNEGFGLIDSGLAKVTKDMTDNDYKVTSNEGQVDGKLHMPTMQKKL